MTIKEELKRRLHNVFNLLPDKDDEQSIIQSIRDDVEFRGVRIWILICAIFIASLGLNVNSTAVIIGAMLISPLMNPIVGLGLGLAIYDISLVKRSLRSLGIMVLISITTATIYFLISPLSQAQSELLARTQPTIYDVLIAIAGGVAGILASSTKVKGNILMGVAIATALMPPLCTAGYGLSQGSLAYVLGAGYLFSINTIFIALSTMVVVRIMRFRPVSFVSVERERKIRHWTIAIIIGFVAPSIYSGFGLVRNSIREDAVNRFVRDELNTHGHQALRYSLVQTDSTTYLDVALLGRRVETSERDSLERIMRERYDLSDMTLSLRQDFISSVDSVDLELNKELLMKQLYHKQEELFRRQQEEQDSLKRLISKAEEFAGIEQEILTLYPELKACRIARLDFASEVTYIVAYRSGKALTSSAEVRLRLWLMARLECKQITVIRLE